VLKNRKLVGIVTGFVQKALNQARRHVNSSQMQRSFNRLFALVSG
jgi:hypothetical protein